MATQKSLYTANGNLLTLLKGDMTDDSKYGVAKNLAFEEIIKEEDMSLTREEMNARIGQSEAELRAEIAEFKSDIKTGFAEIRAEISKSQAETHKAIVDLIKWIVGVGIALATIFFTGLNYFNNTTNKNQTQVMSPIAPAEIKNAKSK